MNIGLVHDFSAIISKVISRFSLLFAPIGLMIVIISNFVPEKFGDRDVRAFVNFDVKIAYAVLALALSDYIGQHYALRYAKSLKLMVYGHFLFQATGLGLGGTMLAVL
ncbi:hypothetical protein [Novosphingobium terrae]|uniref:hypothetical protein n=1 Tax=Novosphingobium terrae TaxID=2726189 RepID=UPI00197FCEE1|nr:hypothetical protein [Novosphingobium terrae]